jgi:hypothetical protein
MSDDDHRSKIKREVTIEHWYHIDCIPCRICDMKFNFELDAVRDLLMKGDSEEARDLVKQALLSASDRALIAFKHPLGFLRIQLLREGPVGLYVHIWTSRISMPRPTTTGIHSHNWWLLSRIITGSIENRVYTVEECDNSGDYQIFTVKHDNNVDNLLSTGRYVKCRLANRTLHTTDECYQLPPNTFHFSIPHTAVDTVTLILASHRSSESEYVLGHPEQETHQIRRSPCASTELDGIVVSLLSVVSKPIF